jgi:hypothetical protein
LNKQAEGGIKNEAIYSSPAGTFILSPPFLFDNKLSDNVTRELDDRVSLSSAGTFPPQVVFPFSTFIYYLKGDLAHQSIHTHTHTHREYPIRLQMGGYKRRLAYILSNVWRY